MWSHLPHPHDHADHCYNCFLRWFTSQPIDYVINGRPILLVMLEEFPLKYYYWPCDYNPHLWFDETCIPMWNCLRISFWFWSECSPWGGKKPPISKESFILAITFWQIFLSTQSVFAKVNGVRKFLTDSGLWVNQIYVFSCNDMNAYFSFWIFFFKLSP